jgi:putative FmdB family regulatory protein|tara:strand:- start:178 stop:435 length:258 start_codon:yes stop_codon:yes gene_type:complete
MPRYAYLCSECHKIFEVTHSYKEKVTDCSLCGEKDCVSKFLGTPINLKDKQTKKRKQTGEVVQQTIEDVKIEIEEQKRNLRKIKK